ncbi:MULTISPECIES: hypothetical protein [Pseudomonas syringae group]|uniref:hypothetical protein n=1 Tax=Pseudomonas syringae group TaxID=136849 RepID=UPI0006D6281B|nr:hypothetical protein [Pseudomonas coronafaciens]KPX31925.1 Uncharacterized protein ALO77_00006 [Pseudomonas coronafaciens pv. garcae]RMV81965.1 hypothetical protein ALP02_02454 [Pseudomonas coronafaciens pv. garcae]
MQRQHYYVFTFLEARNGQAIYANAYHWLPEQKVTKQVIATAKLNATVSSSATVMNCSYLGYMTAEEFELG